MVLKNGMNVKLKNGEIGLVLGEYVQFWDMALPLDTYDENYNHLITDDYTIVEVHDVPDCCGLKYALKRCNLGEELYNRYGEKLNRVGD